MPQSKMQIPSEYVVPLNMNGLKGRMLRMPPPKGKIRESLFVYGHHSSLERWYSLAQVLNDYSGVTMPDLPGFGGMDSFYKINEKPNLDTMADYLASVVRLRYKGRRFTLLGLSYGFTVATRMLERYPDIAAQVDLLISCVGFTKREELQFTPSRYWFYRSLATFFSAKPTAAFFHNVVLHPTALRTFYSHTHNARLKYDGLSSEEQQALNEFEIHLWRINEVRTYMTTTLTMLTLDNTKWSVQLPVWHIFVANDHYFNNKYIEKNMLKIFTDYNAVQAPIKHHVPNVMAGRDEARTFIPKKIEQLLNAKPKVQKL